MKHSIVTSVILVAVSVSQSLSADDTKIYPGSMCVPVSSKEVYELKSSAILNPSTVDRLHVDCPLIHDITNKTLEAWVRVVNYSSKHDIECFLVKTSWEWGTKTVLYDIDETIDVREEADAIPRSITSEPALSGKRENTYSPSFTEMKITLPGGKKADHYFISCKIPPIDATLPIYEDKHPKSRILKYRLNEVD